TAQAQVAAAKAATPPRPRRRRALLALAVLVLLVAGAAGWWFLVRVPVHEVPDFAGQDVVAATAAAEELGWTVDTSTLDRRDGTEPGDVLAQDPASGSSLAEGEVVRLTVSLGATLAAVPEITGQPLADARAAITDAGFVVASETRAFDEEVPIDAVISSTPVDVVPEADGRLPKGTAFDLVISDGPAPRVVPEGLQGARADDAEAALVAVQLEVVRSPSPSNEVPEGYVISVSEEPGTELARGDQVVLEVSSGPPPVPIPDVSFQSGSVAAAMLEADGFTVAGIEGSPSGMVLATDPPAGELHERGTAVRIFTRT
ncbi:MAG: PASTA domain-containing protein, partial [Microthrixaceae bacterium]